MNETSATSQSGASLLPEGIGTLTTVHLVIVALLAIAAVAIIVAGIRRKRIRTHAAHEMARHAEEAGVAVPSAEPERVAEVAPPPTRRETPAPVATPEPTRLDDEPIAAAAPMEATPASEASPESAVPPPAPPPPPAGSAADQPVTLLKGLGPKVSAALADRGITTVGQLAALNDAEAAALDAELGPFRGRMTRDRWIEQARFLAAGDRAGFEAVFGKL